MNYCPCTHNLWPYTPFSFRKTSDKIELVVTGPYRLVRHPVYTSLILGIWIIPTLVSIFLEIIIVPITNLQVEILTFEITAWVYGAVKVLYTWTLTQQRRPYYMSTIPMHQAPGNEATQYLVSICTSFIMCSLIHLFVCGIITFWKYLSWATLVWFPRCYVQNLACIVAAIFVRDCKCWKGEPIPEVSDGYILLLLQTVGHFLLSSVFTGYIVFAMVLYEEPDLVNALGPEYTKYMKKTPRFFPNLPSFGRKATRDWPTASCTVKELVLF